ncbi:PH domain-containing protein [Ectobacillus polymachus]|uniref:PH domain-containing protein n=1 Tax=Ectobacillus polymachus TaxID=1508806 RepID=UPI003A883E03
MYKNLLSIAKMKLKDGEGLGKIIYGTYHYYLQPPGGLRKGILIATTKRILFVGDYFGVTVVEKYYYENIRSITSHKNLFGVHSIVFFHNGSQEMITDIEIGKAEDFVTYVKEKLLRFV